MNQYIVVMILTLASFVACKPTITKNQDLLLTGMEKISKRSLLDDAEKMDGASHVDHFFDNGSDEAFVGDGSSKILNRLVRALAQSPVGPINAGDDLEPSEDIYLRPFYSTKRKNYLDGQLL